MNYFKIQSIEYGWWQAQMGKLWLECSDYLNYDMPKELLRKILKLLNGNSHKEWLYVMDEPGASMICMKLGNDKINFAEYHSLKTSYELNLDEGKVTEFSLYENGNGRTLYEYHWMDFPVDEYKELKLYAFELQDNTKENEGFFYTTYLNK